MKETEINWDKMADFYEEFTAGKDSYSRTIEWPCIQKMLPPIAGKRVVDLGCGTGRFTFWLEEEKPAYLLGADLSENMLRLAKKKAAELGSAAVFLKADVSRPFTEEKFDVAFSSTLTHYLPDLDAFFLSVNNMLTERGQCVFSVMNPVYTAQYPIRKDHGFPGDDDWTVRYLDKRERAYIQPWIEHNDSADDFLSFSRHYTFSDYIRALNRANLRITEIEEPYPPENWKVRCPERYDSFIETPSYLIFKAVKQEQTPLI